MLRRMIACILVVTALMCCLTGCINAPSEEDLERNACDAALEYLSEKYGETFEYLEPDGMLYWDTRSFLFTCDSYGEDNPVKVTVRGFRDPKTYVILDSYMENKFEDEANAYLKDEIKEYFVDNISYVNNSCVSEKLDLNTTLDEYIKDSNTRIEIKIYTPYDGTMTRESFRKIVGDYVEDFSLHDLYVDVVLLRKEDYTRSVELKLAQSEIANEYVLPGKHVMRGGVTWRGSEPGVQTKSDVSVTYGKYDSLIYMPESAAEADVSESEPADIVEENTSEIGDDKVSMPDFDDIFDEKPSESATDDASETEGTVEGTSEGSGLHLYPASHL